MSITLTETAAGKVKEILNQKGKLDHALRVFVQGGGCSGLSYGMTLDQPQEGDQLFEEHGVRVIVDSRSFQFIDGSHIDFVESMMGGGFKVENPNSASECGCGSSFQPKQGTAGAPGGKTGGGCGGSGH